MTGTELRTLLNRSQLRQVDCAWICGVHFRQVRAWVNDEYPVPQYAFLLMAALDEGLITPKWLARKIKSTPP
jgi:hypothetical protein